MSQESLQNNQSDWRGSSFLVVMLDWAAKNASMPTDLTTLIAYVLLLLLVWYLVLWMARFVLALIWPVIIIVSAVLIFRFLRAMESNDLEDIFKQTLAIVADKMMATLAKTIEFILNFLT